MPIQVEPKVFIIAKTEPDMEAIANWHTSLGVEYDPEEADNYHSLLDIYANCSPGEILTAMAGKRCYNSFVPGLNPNVTKIRENVAEYIDNILASSHGSVLQHVNYTFAIEGVSRVFTAEFNRHSAGTAISEGSGRYIRFDEIPYWIPPSIQEMTFGEFLTERDITPKDEDEYNDAYNSHLYKQWLEIEVAKARTRDEFYNAFSYMEDAYARLSNLWDYGNLRDFSEKKKLTSLFRRIIGQGVATGGVWTGNLRALRHIITMRCSPHAEEEIRHVATLMLEAMMSEEPSVFGDFERVNGYYEPKYKKV